MRPCRLLALVSALPLVGCLLTSDFDGITGGGPGVLDAGEIDAGPWTPTPCLGKLECLTFDEATNEPNGWRIDRTDAGSGQVARVEGDVAIGPGALQTRVAADSAPSATQVALLYKYLDVASPTKQVAWGFDARIETCDGVASAGELGSITLSGLQPSNEGFFGLLVAPGVDLVGYTDSAGQRTTWVLPRRMPRGAWFHVDFQLTLGAPDTTLVTSLNGNPLLTSTFPASTPSRQILLNVGLFADSPSAECRATFDNYYFDEAK